MMEEQKEVLKAKYECQNCKTLVEIDKKTNMKNIICHCGISNWILLSYEITSKDDNETSQSLNGCYLDIQLAMKRYCDLQDWQYQLVPIWILGTYLHNSFPTFPHLFLNAQKGSGKTRLLGLMEALCHNGNKIVNISESVLFRMAKNHTLIIDEFESIGNRDKNVLRELLNSAYKKGAVVSRVRKTTNREGELYVIDKFELYTPIIMANIWGMEEVLEDRCISINLEKSNKSSVIKLIEDFEDNHLIKDIKKRLNELKCRWCMLVASKNIIEQWNIYIDTLYTSTLPTLPTLDNTLLDFFKKIDKTEIDGRNLELFFPIFVIAKLIGEDVLDSIIKIANVIVTQKKKDELLQSRDVSLIDFIAKMDILTNFLPLKDLTATFKEFLQEDSSEDTNKITSEWMSRALKRLNLVIERRRLSRGNEVILNIPKAKEKLKMFKKEEV